MSTHNSSSSHICNLQSKHLINILSTNLDNYIIKYAIAIPFSPCFPRVSYIRKLSAEFSKLPRKKNILWIICQLIKECSNPSHLLSIGITPQRCASNATRRTLNVRVPVQISGSAMLAVVLRYISKFERVYATRLALSGLNVPILYLLSAVYIYTLTSIVFTLSHPLSRVFFFPLFFSFFFPPSAITQFQTTLDKPQLRINKYSITRKIYILQKSLLFSLRSIESPGPKLFNLIIIFRKCKLGELTS